MLVKFPDDELSRAPGLVHVNPELFVSWASACILHPHS